MKNVSFILFAAAMLSGCARGGVGGELSVLDLEAAIDNRRTFDVSEIAKSVEFVALDDSNREGLLGEIIRVAESKDKYYIQDSGRDVVFKIFDRQGRFISTLGRYGRGPNEFAGWVRFTADHDRDNIWVAGTLGDRTDATIAYDGTGRQIVRRDSISGGEMVFFDDRLIVSKDSPASFSLGNDPDFVSSIGTKVPFLEVYSTDLRHERTIETVDKGNGDALFIEGSGNLSDPSNIRSIGVYPGPEVILSSNGRSLLVKEPLGDTVYHYRDGALEAAFRFHAGRYAPPAGSFGVNPSVERGDSYLVRNILDSDRWVFVEAVGAMGSVGTMLVFDRDDSSKGFSATGGPDGKPGLFFDGLAFTPLYVRDGRLVGHISALTIVDNAESLSNPDLKALAARLKEDSNPVLVMVELK